ncbi:hypothetical protein ABEV58_21425, partial [Bacillus paralicheniformis]
FSVSRNPRIRCQACASVLTNSNIRSAPMLGLPRLQRFSITLKGFCQKSETADKVGSFFNKIKFE